MRELQEARKYLEECNDLIDNVDYDLYEILYLSVLKFVKKCVSDLAVKALFVSRCEEIHAMKKIELTFRGYTQNWEEYGIGKVESEARVYNCGGIKVPDYGSYTVDAPAKDKLKALKKLIEDAMHYFNLVALGNGSAYNDLYSGT
ncbi:MAG: hypothetical protein JW891_07940 [Candidatus Lokiarchaeota archaeon]|nr:hypothetical protein [Candidatus Lokiarchaeota archaeon]